MRTATAIVAALAVTLSCAPALRGPAPAATVGAGALGPVAAPQGRSPAALLADARAELARRPDVAAVRRAESLFLAAAEADPEDVEGLYGAIQAKLWLAGQERDPSARGRLVSSAVDAGRVCLKRAPDDARCDYGLALALGLDAQEHHATALDAVKVMVSHLRRAAKEDPSVDHGGPERVLALVLARAPAWPVGPGDPESAVSEARQAEGRAPDWAPNALALAEALLVNGDAAGGHAAAQRALALARAAAKAGDPDAAGWIADAQKLEAAPAGGNAAQSPGP